VSENRKSVVAVKRVRRTSGLRNFEQSFAVEASENKFEVKRHCEDYLLRLVISFLRKVVGGSTLVEGEEDSTVEVEVVEGGKKEIPFSLPRVPGCSLAEAATGGVLRRHSSLYEFVSGEKKLRKRWKTRQKMCQLAGIKGKRSND
jgi:hypothetical protein